MTLLRPGPWLKQRREEKFDWKVRTTGCKTATSWSSELTCSVIDAFRYADRAIRSVGASSRRSARAAQQPCELAVAALLRLERWRCGRCRTLRLPLRLF